jgi:antitoxin component YwqK of YwqJK toxin-antitoxin module
MRKFLFLAIAILATFPVFAQDTLTVHVIKLVSENGIYKADDVTVSAEIFKKLQDEQTNFQNKSQNKVCWVRRLDKYNHMLEQGFFCNGTKPVGTHFKYDSKGQVKYKKVYSGVKVTVCGQSEVGTKATEEIQDFSKGLRIYGSYSDGLKQGQFIYYEKGIIVGVEAFEKGQLLRRTGKIFSLNDDGSLGSTTSSTMLAKK